MRLGFVLVLALMLGACGSSAGEQTGTTDSVVVSSPDASDSVTTTEAPATTTSAETASTGDLPDPCSLLSTDVIETATGLAFDEGTFNETLSSERQAICDWIGSEEFATVQTLVLADDNWDMQKSSAADAFDVVDVTIPGADRAYATVEGSIIGMSAGGRFVQVSYIPTGPGDVMDATSQLAIAAIANLTG